MTSRNQESFNHNPPAQPQNRRRVRVLCVDEDDAVRRRIADLLADHPVSLHSVATSDEARSALKAHEYDVLLVDAGRHAAGFALAEEVSHSTARTRAIVLCNRPTVALSVKAMRAGAVDLLKKPVDPQELTARISAAAEQADSLRAQARRIDRLTRICKRLKSTRHEVAQEVDILCNNLAAAYEELANHTERPSVTTEYAARIRTELDVESLLRITLEFVLKHAGSTNAAIFLPTGHSDFSLGAYVNYDLPKDAADVLLDHLADKLPAQFDAESRLCHFTTGVHFESVMDEPIEWLESSTVIVMPCHAENECLAVVALFRDQTRQFPPEVVPSLEAVRDLFANQLHRVVRIHNRHKGQDAWPGFEVDTPEADDYDSGYHTPDNDADDYGMAA